MKKTVTIFILVLIVAGALFLFSKENAGLVDDKQSAALKIAQNKGQEVTLIINNSLGQPEVFEAEFFEGMTAFDLLNDIKNGGIETKSFDIGTMVQAIGDVENGKDNKYWLYYVNNQMPSLAVDKNKIAPEDIVEFRFEKPPF